jgi:LPXTG-site transpeptidase (sortase) family protein
MTRREKIKFVVMRSIGNFLVLFSIYGVIATFGPALYYEVRYRVIQARGVEYRIADIQQGSLGEIVEANDDVTQQDPGLGQILTGSTEQVLSPKDTEFSIIIPKIGASAKVIPNVDPTDEDAFKPALMKGIAHAKGTVFPGLAGNTYLFAHSTDNWWNVGRYNAIFYLLKDLTLGDEVVVFFEGKRHDYIVTKTYVAEATDVELLVNSQQGEEQLVMQTCWPPGTTWKRFFVVAKPKSVVE